MLLPVVQCYLFCTCIGRDPQGLKLGVVNEELRTGMASCSSYPSSGCNFSIPLSCRYLQNLRDKSYKLVSIGYLLLALTILFFYKLKHLLLIPFDR